MAKRTIPAGGPTKQWRRATIEITARGETALASFKSSRAVDLQYGMRRRAGGRHPEGWVVDEESDIGDGLAIDGDSASADANCVGVVGSMRLDPDPGGFREKYLRTFGGLRDIPRRNYNQIFWSCATDVLSKATVPTELGSGLGRRHDQR